MKTSDVVKTVNTYVNNESDEDFKTPDNFATDVSWIASALAVTDTSFDKSSVLLSCGNSIASHCRRNSFGHMAREDQIGVILLGVRCLDYSEPIDSQQIRLKQETYPFLIEKLGDLQIPIILSFDEAETNASLINKYAPFEMILSYLNEHHSNQREDITKKYIAESLDEVVQLYKSCMVSGDGKYSTINRKIGNAYNEMGKQYIDSLILASVATDSADESDSMATVDGPVVNESYQAMASNVLQKAIVIFEECNDVHNFALCEANMGRLHQVLSTCHRTTSKELSIEEESDIKVSIGHYRRAADVLTKDMVKLKESLIWDLVNVQLRLALLYQENPPLSRLSVKELERKLIDVLDSAEKNSNSILKTTDNPDRVHLRIAEINYRIAAMHHGHIVESDISSGKTLNHSIRLALRYYSQSHAHFNSVPWKNQNQSWCLLHLRASIESMALLKNHKTDRNRLIDGLKTIISASSCIDRLYHINPAYHDDITKTAVKIIQMVLMEMKKNISHFKSITETEVKEVILICLKGDGTVKTIYQAAQKLKLICCLNEG